MNLLSCVIYTTIFLFSFILEVKCVINNVCPTYQDYYTVRDNPNCWYDFSADSNVTDTIIKSGYPIEVHTVTTSDGYILTMFRLPNYGSETPKQSPVFLQHGLAATSANFVGKGRDSLGFLLADAGYDVWLGNFRGSEYSEGHVNLTVFDTRYWDHSMDELGLLDIPTQLDFISEKTGQRGNIIYIGHSLGTTLSLIYSSSYPHEARKTLKLIIMMAPAVSLLNMRSPTRFLAPLAEQLYQMTVENDLVRIGSQAAPLKNVIRPFCLESPILMRRCIDMFNVLYGPKTQMGPDLIPIYFQQLPAGTSLRVTRHAADLVLGQFRRYDYGAYNIRKYGTYLPPNYDITKVEVPIFIMYAVNDWTCTKKDSQLLYKRLPRRIRAGIHEVSDPNFNHIDFIFGRNVKTLAYDPILRLIEKLEN